MPTKQRTSTDFLALTISAGEGVSDNNEGWTEHPLFRFRYTVKVVSDATGATIEFRYWDSADRHDRCINQLDRENLLYAFRSFVMDAQSVDEATFDEWLDEYGYDSDSRKVRREHKRIFDACKASLRKFNALWHDARKPAFILDMLSAEGIE